MSAILIYGLRIHFRDLWVKSGVKEVRACDCEETNYRFCPYCGVDKNLSTRKVYRSLLTGDDTLERSLLFLLEYLYENKLGYHDNGDCYTDDYIYLYCKSPNCMATFNEKTGSKNFTPVEYNVENRLKTIVGEQVWNKGEFGLWYFIEKPADLPREKVCTRE